MHHFHYAGHVDGKELEQALDLLPGCNCDCKRQELLMNILASHLYLKGGSQLTMSATSANLAL